jgi:hypothetical protein
VGASVARGCGHQEETGVGLELCEDWSAQEDAEDAEEELAETGEQGSDT